MSTIKKLFPVFCVVCLLFTLTACPTPTIPTPPDPVAPTVIGTYTISNMDESESTVVFYSDNTYTEGEEDYIAVKGTFTGTVAEGETVTLTPVEFNFGEDVDLFMTAEAALSAFGDDEYVQLIIAFAFIPQDYTISGTTLINVTGDDPEEPAAIAFFSADIGENQSITFIFYDDETYKQLVSGNTLATC